MEIINCQHRHMSGFFVKEGQNYQRHIQTHRLKIDWQLHERKKKTNRQIIVHKTQHRKLKTKQHKPHQKLGLISGTPQGHRSCCTCGTCRVAHVNTNPLNSPNSVGNIHCKREQDCSYNIRTYPISSVKLIFNFEQC